MAKDENDQVGQIGWSPDFRARKRRRELPGQLLLPFEGAPPPLTTQPQQDSRHSSPPNTMTILAWKRVALAGPVGVRIQHKVGHLHYQPLVTVLGPPGDVGDLSFDLQRDHATLFNSGVSHGRYALVSFVLLEPAKEAR